MTMRSMDRVLRPAVWLVLTAGVLLVAWYVVAPKGVVAEPLAPVATVSAVSQDTDIAEPTVVVQTDVVVYVTGAVARPGLYALAPNARVGAAVAAAGGMTTDASYDAVNMAEHLVDAQHVKIPFRTDTTASPADAVASGSAPGVIAINSASAAELEQLPGIGASMAERIVAFRAAHGPFKELTDLDAVSGIGTALLERLKPFVRF